MDFLDKSAIRTVSLLYQKAFVMTAIQIDGLEKAIAKCKPSKQTIMTSNLKRVKTRLRAIDDEMSVLKVIH